MLAYERTGFLGASLARTGVYDLIVSETLWRLIDPGDAVIDAGANIGYMTSIMARRVGPTGRIDAFEPHPETFRRLLDNVERWNAPITLHNAALSDTDGTVDLFTVADADVNQIRASLTQLADAGHAISVPTVTLDDVLRHQPTLLKIDIEGAEALALRGANRILARLRHIIYEDHDPQPSDLTRQIRQAGFTVFALEERFFGPAAHADIDRERLLGWDAPSLLATRHPETALARLAPRGWRCLRT